MISIILPCFNEENNINEIYSRLSSVMQSVREEYELIFVDDGSRDTTWEKIKKLHQQDTKVRGIKFSKNFGHQYALFAGLSYARGKAVIIMDADLQHPPAIIPKLLEEWQRGFKIVHTIRKDNKNIPWHKKLSSKLFYKVFSLLSGVNLTEGMADYRLYDRQVVNELMRLKEVNLFLRGLSEWLGFNSSKVEFECDDRFSGNSKYSLKKMLNFAVEGISSFSLVPLRIAIVLGLLTSVAAFYQLFETIYIKLFTLRAVPGWASIMVSMSFLFGILFILIGILGEYIGRILVQVRERPKFIISERLEGGVMSSEEK